MPLIISALQPSALGFCGGGSYVREWPKWLKNKALDIQDKTYGCRVVKASWSKYVNCYPDIC